MKIHLLQFAKLLCLSLLISNCQSESKPHASNESSAASVTQTIDSNDQYRDTMIDELIQNDNDVVRTDYEALSELTCNSPTLHPGHQFNYDSIKKYDNLIPLITTKSYEEIWGYGCLGQLIDSKSLSARVVLSNMQESHYSSSIDLVIYKNDTSIDICLKLAQSYMNENYERHIESVLKSNSLIIRTIQEKTKKEQMKTIEWYKINAVGEVELLSSEMIQEKI